VTDTQETTTEATRARATQERPTSVRARHGITEAHSTPRRRRPRCERVVKRWIPRHRVRVRGSRAEWAAPFATLSRR
jgi:hypothetical protein